MFWFVVVLFLAGACFYFYQKMLLIEREIRAEQATGQAPVEEAKAPVDDSDGFSDSEIVTSVVDKMTTKVVPVADVSFCLVDEILAAVINLPGVKQTELYDSFADVSRKQFQQVVKELADSGRLKRKKQGSSYLLYPV